MSMTTLLIHPRLWKDWLTLCPATFSWKACALLHFMVIRTDFICTATSITGQQRHILKFTSRLVRKMVASSATVVLMYMPSFLSRIVGCLVQLQVSSVRIYLSNRSLGQLLLIYSINFVISPLRYDLNALMAVSKFSICTLVSFMLTALVNGSVGLSGDFADIEDVLYVLLFVLCL